MMDYKGCKCASCHKVLKEGDDIVICPECGAPYHRECYAAAGRPVWPWSWWACCCWCAALRFPHGSDRIA